MARARSLKPGLFKNERLAELPLAARFLFPGLWTLADRAGRLEDRPKRIKAEIFPYDDEPIDDLLDELHHAGFIVRYVVDGQRFICIPTWEKHQNPHHREAPSTIPGPEQAPGQPQAQPRLSTAEPGTSRADSLFSDSLNLTPSSKDICSTKTVERMHPKINGNGKQPPEGFEEFWEAYPRKKSKPAAVKAYDAKATSPEKRNAIIAGLRRQLPRLKELDRGFVPYPAKYLREEQFLDEPDPPRETEAERLARL